MCRDAFDEAVVAQAPEVMSDLRAGHVALADDGQAEDKPTWTSKARVRKQASLGRLTATAWCGTRSLVAAVSDPG